MTTVHAHVEQNMQLDGLGWWYIRKHNLNLCIQRVKLSIATAAVCNENFRVLPENLNRIQTRDK
jgi:hypothetical protein